MNAAGPHPIRMWARCLVRALGPFSVHLGLKMRGAHFRGGGSEFEVVGAKKKNIQIKLENGLDARPVALLVQVASKFESTIYIQSEGKKVNAKSIMGVLSLNLSNPVDVKPDTTDISSAQRFFENIVKFRE